MSNQWTIVDEAGAALLADAGFATYVDFIDRQPGQEVGKSSTTRTTRFRISEPRTGVRGRSGESAVRHGVGIPAHPPHPPPAAAGGSDDAGPCDFFIKVYRYAGDQWRHRFRRDKATLEAENYALLDDIGIGTPGVVAFGSRRSSIRLVDAVIITRGLPDVISLDRLFEQRWPDDRKHANDSLRADVLAQVLDEVRRMHDAGFFHIDLQWRNILIGGWGEEPSARPGESPRETVRHQPSARFGRPNVYFLDAPRGGLRRTPWAREHGRLRDLSCLYKEARRRLSRTEQLRWLLIYLGEDQVTPRARSMIHALSFDRSVKDNDGTTS